MCVQDLIDYDYGVDGSKLTEFEDSLRKQVTEIKKINDLNNGIENKNDNEITKINIEEKDLQNKNDKEITKINIEEKDRHAYNVGEDNKATPNKKNTRIWNWNSLKKKQTFLLRRRKKQGMRLSMICSFV